LYGLTEEEVGIVGGNNRFLSNIYSMEKIKNISIIALAYLTICGSLYYLVFWKTFDLNGFSYLNFTDIVRSALFAITISPFIYIPSMIIFFGAFWEGIARLQGKSKIKILDDNESWIFLFWIIVGSILYFVIADLTGSMFMLKIFTILFFLAQVFYRLKFLENLTKNPMFSELLRAFLIFIPFLCYDAAKINSKNILLNIDYKYMVRDVDNKVDTLKYLANSGSNFIFTDLENNKIILLKLDTVTLYKNSSK
jgi:hypothetical protein